MRLLTASRYGTRMVLEIALHGKNGPVQMREIAKHQDISQKYLEKIIRQLKKAGIIVSVRGPKGGHLLARPPAEVTVGEVVRILEGDTFLVDCLKCPEICANVPHCLTRMIWQEGSQAMFRKFDQITFAELIRYAEQGIKFGDVCPACGKPEANGGGPDASRAGHPVAP